MSHSEPNEATAGPPAAFLLGDPKALASHLMQSRALFAPEASGGEVHWQRAREPVAPETPPLRPFTSPKQFFFAEREVLFVFDGKRFKQTLPEPEPAVLFGVTACDLVAIAYQDRFFRDDPHYTKRRAAVLLVGVDCTKLCPGAFCGVVDAGPTVRPATADLVLQPLAQAGYILIAETEAGRAALRGLELEDAPLDWRELRSRAVEEAESELDDAPVIQAGIARLNRGEIGDETWEALGLLCVTCSGCTTVCPTCSCFAPRDVPEANQGPAFSRERVWDSCLFEGFQREASGNNPSGLPGQRVERFWYHKFSDDFARDFGRYGCVGCGRCDSVCPSAIGARSVLSRLAQA